MKNKLRYFMVLTALAMCFGTFSVTAYAQSNEPQEETAPVEETTEPEETATPNPFTPNGTGTVLDNATTPPVRTKRSFIPSSPKMKTSFIWSLTSSATRIMSTSSMRSRSLT